MTREKTTDPCRVPLEPLEPFRRTTETGRLRCASSIAASDRFAVGAPSVVLGLAMLGLSACTQAKNPGPPPAMTVPVLVATAQQKDVPLQVRTIGTVESSSDVSVRPQVGGVILEVRFKEGQKIAKGQTLFTIDPRPYEAVLAETEARLARDKAMSLRAKADVTRYEDLAGKDKNYVTQQQLDSVRAAATSASETVKADEAAVEQARLNLSFCTIDAPISGRAGEVLIHSGNLLKANDDRALVVLRATQPIHVSFAIPEMHLHAVQPRPGQPPLEVAVSSPRGGSAPRLGILSFIDNTVNTATGTIQLKATFPNEDESLWPGQFVDVVLTLNVDRAAVVVPSQAVQTGQQGQFVFVVKSDATVESRPVVVARTFEEETILQEGIAAGETVVTDGQLRLVPGTKVEIKQGGEKNEGAPS